jgi:hypothetical protein
LGALHTFLGRLRLGATGSRTLPGSKRFQPCLEGLEHRDLLSIQLVAGANVNVAVATFSDPGGAAPLALGGGLSDHYVASIDWGDGSAVTAGLLTLNGSMLTVNGDHTYIDPGSYMITATVNHDGILTTVQTAAAAVSLGQAQPNEVASIAFWHGSRGQTLIKSFNGGPASTALANWLATHFPKLYGAQAGTHNLTGQTNMQVAAFFQSIYGAPNSPPNLDAEVLATALNVYATTLSLGGTAGQQYGFLVDNAGLGARTWNVGQNGQPFGVPNYSNVTVNQLLQAANNNAAPPNGKPWGSGSLSVLLRDQALKVFNSLNEMGTIS